ESDAATGLGILALGLSGGGVVQPIANTMAHADLVVFSPSGKVALFYSAALQQAQVVAGVPANAQIVQTLDLTVLDGVPVTSIAVSDDAQAVLVGVSDGISGAVWFFTGAQPQKLMSLGVPSALRFFAGKYDAVVAHSGWTQLSPLPGSGQQVHIQVLPGPA